MKKLIKKEIQSLVDEFNHEFNNSTKDDQTAFFNALYFVGIVFLLSIFIL